MGGDSLERTGKASQKRRNSLVLHVFFFFSLEGLFVFDDALPALITPVACNALYTKKINAFLLDRPFFLVINDSEK